MEGKLKGALVSRCLRNEAAVQHLELARGPLAKLSWRSVRSLMPRGIKKAVPVTLAG
jgi:hypothetical protein